MVTDLSKDALIAFIESMERRGTLPAKKTKVWLTAIRAMLTDLSPAEDADIRKLDVESAFQRVYNKSPTKYGPATLQEYRVRINRAISEFERWAADPSGYKYSGPSVDRDKMNARKEAKASALNSPQTGPPKKVRADSPPPAQSNGLALQYPLRPDFLAQVLIPRDLKADEARRIAAFIKTLATDFSPTDE